MLVADDHASASEDAIVRRLQSEAIEVVVAHEHAAAVTRAASALGVPVARAGRDADIEAAASAALAAARSFAEPQR